MPKKLNLFQYPRVEISFNPKVPPIKELEDKTKVNVRYCLIYPFAFVHIYWDSKEYELKYEVEEPILNEEEEFYKDQIISAMKNIINFDVVVKKEQEELLKYIDHRFKVIASELGINLSYESYKKIYYYLCRDFIGFNEIDPVLRDYFIEDIECNGVNTPVYVVHRVFRNLKTNIIFNETKGIANLVEKIAQRCGKYISHANPVLDGSLPDGSRVNATYTKDITSRGPTFTIRKFTKTPWTPPQLVGFRSLSPEIVSYLWLLVQYKMNLLLSGGTASGKTTLLNAIAFFIPPEDRVVSIEDTRELNLPRENWLPSVVRGSTGNEKFGEVDLFTLLKSSFRQNPDYVVVGEVRGKEAFVLFQGMASGHSSISTMHSDSVDTLIKRLETPPIELSPTLLNVLDCVCVMTHAIVNKEETRKLKKIVEIVNITSEGVAKTNTPFIWNPSDDNFYFKTNSKILEKISERHGIPKKELDKEFTRRSELIYKMFQQKIFGFKEFQKIVNEYYKQPEKILKRFGIK